MTQYNHSKENNSLEGGGPMPCDPPAFSIRKKEEGWFCTSAWNSKQHVEGVTGKIFHMVGIAGNSIENMGLEWGHLKKDFKFSNLHLKCAQ